MKPTDKTIGELLQEMAEPNSLISLGQYSDSSYYTVKKGTPYFCDTDHCVNGERFESRHNAPTLDEAIYNAWVAWCERKSN